MEQINKKNLLNLVNLTYFIIFSFSFSLLIFLNLEFKLMYFIILFLSLSIFYLGKILNSKDVIKISALFLSIILFLILIEIKINIILFILLILLILFYLDIFSFLTSIYEITSQFYVLNKEQKKEFKKVFIKKILNEGFIISLSLLLTLIILGFLVQIKLILVINPQFTVVLFLISLIILFIILLNRIIKISQ